VLGNALLRVGPWGLNLFLWTAALVTAMMVLVHRHGTALTGEGRLLLVPVILFASLCVWRDSVPLKLLDVMALVVFLSLAAFYGQGGHLRTSGIMDYTLGGIVAGFNVLSGFLLFLLKDIQWKEISHTRWSRHAIAVGCGLIIACPLLLIFGGLFTMADPIFKKIIRGILHVDFKTLFTHTFLIAFYTWITGGFLRGMLFGDNMAIVAVVRSVLLSSGISRVGILKEDSHDDTSLVSGFPSLGIIETGIVLGLLDSLFLCFIIVQFRYFFGGEALVKATIHLTYAEYARQGFFELVVVTALVLPLLLLLHWLLRRENPAHERIFRLMAGVQVLMLFVIMVPAFQRMRLYQSEYGLTELRLYATAFMGWLAVVFLWFMATVLRGRREHFAFGALVAGFLMIAVLHILNPDLLIIRTNIARAEAGRPFDVHYATSLSADAVPALVRVLPVLSQQDRCVVADHLLKRWVLPESSDWRTWSRSRAEARWVVQGHEATLREMVCH
ncbi:MAG: DUF4173 domain-containing protein, partial [Candidatus Latescibacteria bacterium]|nr:DUF4173 domain-containing protein [Candidatus Latescibacterota bacterium]